MRLRKFRLLPKPELNNTTRFLLPSLRLSFNEMVQHGFVNSYISDHSHEVLHDEHLYVLFNPLKFTIDFERYCETLRTNPLFEEEYDCTGDGKVMFVFRVPKEYLNIISLFKKGAYSKFPKEYIEKCFSKVTDTGKASRRWQVLTKDPEYKKILEKKMSIEGKDEVVLDKNDELWSIPDKSKEIYHYDPKIEMEQWVKLSDKEQ